MYCTTCSSLAPRSSCSRISRRRSSARPACESAMVWFWQTRQRNSTAMRCMRASSTGSSAAGAASFPGAAATRAHSNSAHHLAIEVLQQRHDLRVQHLGCQRADVLEADDAALVDDKRFGHAVDAEVDADAAIEIGQRHVVRIAELLEP